MAHISGEVTIDALVEEVFDLVADERTEPRYNPRTGRSAREPASLLNPRAWAPGAR